MAGRDFGAILSGWLKGNPKFSRRLSRRACHPVGFPKNRFARNAINDLFSFRDPLPEAADWLHYFLEIDKWLV